MAIDGNRDSGIGNRESDELKALERRTDLRAPSPESRNPWQIDGETYACRIISDLGRPVTASDGRIGAS